MYWQEYTARAHHCQRVRSSFSVFVPSAETTGFSIVQKLQP